MKEQKFKNKNSAKIISADEKAVKEQLSEMVQDRVEEKKRRWWYRINVPIQAAFVRVVLPVLLQKKRSFIP